DHARLGDPRLHPAIRPGSRAPSGRRRHGRRPGARRRYRVTLALASCVVPGHLGTGTVLSKGPTFRCPGLSGALLPQGVHVVDVSLTLSDGSTVEDTVHWQVEGNREP